jgi:hypothetical protein
MLDILYRSSNPTYFIILIGYFKFRMFNTFCKPKQFSRQLVNSLPGNFS